MLKGHYWASANTCCHFLSSFSQEHRCRVPGRLSQQTQPRYGLAHNPQQQLCIPLISQSWWPWHPCLSLPLSLHSTTSHRWRTAGVNVGWFDRCVYSICSTCFGDPFIVHLFTLTETVFAFLFSILIFLSLHGRLQYRHSTPYVGPPQQYSVQPPGSGTFYPGPGPGEYAAPYRK